MLKDKACKAYNREKPARVAMEDIIFSYFVFLLYSKLNLNCKSPEQMAEWSAMPDCCVLSNDVHTMNILLDRARDSRSNY